MVTSKKRLPALRESVQTISFGSGSCVYRRKTYTDYDRSTLKHRFTEITEIKLIFINHKNTGQYLDGRPVGWFSKLGGAGGIMNNGSKI